MAIAANQSGAKIDYYFVNCPGPAHLVTGLYCNCLDLSLSGGVFTGLPSGKDYHFNKIVTAV
jgi:hypothetical protein